MIFGQIVHVDEVVHGWELKKDKIRLFHGGVLTSQDLSSKVRYVDSHKLTEKQEHRRREKNPTAGGNNREFER